MRFRPRFSGVHRPDPLLGAQPGDPVLAHLQAAFAQFVGDEPVAEGGIVSVDVVGGVDQVRVITVALTHRLLAPGVVGLLGEAQHPAGHRDMDLPVGVLGELADQPVNL